MENLSPGVLVKLLGDMGIEEKTYDDPKPVVLQVRSIVPVLTEGDLWPNQGFLLKVSDFSHAMYVSLPQEHDDMVLCNKLQIGQLIYVKRLEAAYPVPIIKGVKPIPGRHPCAGIPKDLVAVDHLQKYYGVSDLKMGMEDTNDFKKPREKFCSLSALKVSQDERKRRKTLPSKSRNLDSKSEISDNSRRSKKNGSKHIDNDSDCDSALSICSSASATRRRSWNGSTNGRTDEDSDSSVVKHVIKPTSRSGSEVSSAPCYRYESSDDNSNCKTRKSKIGVATKSTNSSDKCRIPSAKRPTKCLDSAVMFSSLNAKKLTESEILWDNLPSTLVNLGKEVSRQREEAMLAAVEALQEASAAERLLKCLSTYSEFKSAKGNDHQPSVDEFLNLHDNLSRSRVIVQSLTNISPLRSTDADPNYPDSIGEALQVALDRKKNATSWIKVALVSDLAPIPTFEKTRNYPVVEVEVTNAAKKPNKSSRPKGTTIVKKHRNGSQLNFTTDHKDTDSSWVKGSALATAAELANSLQDECRAWFLSYIENYVEEVDRKYNLMESDNQVAETMYQVKRVNDWLDLVIKKEGNTVDESELQVYDRIRNKIYGILMKHVERTAKIFGTVTAFADGVRLDNI